MQLGYPAVQVTSLQIRGLLLLGVWYGKVALSSELYRWMDGFKKKKKGVRKRNVGTNCTVDCSQTVHVGYSVLTASSFITFIER